VFQDANRDRVEMMHKAYVVKSEEEGIVLGVDFLRKKGFGLRWAGELGGIDCLVKAERKGKEDSIFFSAVKAVGPKS
jgi:hypothetical protein